MALAAMITVDTRVVCLLFLAAVRSSISVEDDADAVEEMSDEEWYALKREENRQMREGLRQIAAKGDSVGSMFALKELAGEQLEAELNKLPAAEQERRKAEAKELGKDHDFTDPGVMFPPQDINPRELQRAAPPKDPGYCEFGSTEEHCVSKVQGAPRREKPKDAAPTKVQTSKPGAQLWKVQPGADPGLLVRTGPEQSSMAINKKLKAGAIVEEVEIQGDKLHYKRLDGPGHLEDGPADGWVSIKNERKIKRLDL
eukprot:gnl/TRDRNA2_/TRDRNA2_197577_c0_seq1.p1 gnl/TRDRNA2_/TRDRNA2_197577_c0~~gnl/TRDRNA2_/TRDRNA2_197577_c0_seq1.p1  ORF type:complete len:256 (-),score=58.01 gnl/TRDRNA2_/TRDRNA2_197577_c0_seq1:103-870(-)